MIDLEDARLEGEIDNMNWGDIELGKYDELLRRSQYKTWCYSGCNVNVNVYF